MTDRKQNEKTIPQLGDPYPTLKSSANIAASEEMKNRALDKMIPPGRPRKGKFRSGVIQIHLTRACDLSCCNCTQGSQFGGKSPMISPEVFEVAVESLKGYFGVVGIFGGNPAIHPQFEYLCEILRKHIPREQCGLWCNNPLGKGKAMRLTFNPSISNLNCHMKPEAFSEFKRDWPESCPFGLAGDSSHSPVHVSMEKLVPSEEERWNLISDCDINKHWSAMICQFRDEPRAFFCEVAGGQAVLNQFNPDYPDTGVKVDAEWWKQPMKHFEDQVLTHCHQCSVPLRLKGSLAQTDSVTQISEEYSHLKLKGSGKQLIQLNTPEDVDSKRVSKVTHYMQNAE